MSTLYIMCGIPASGKSTIAHEIAKRKRNRIVVSRDAIRFSLVKEDEPYFSREKEVYRTFVNTIRGLLLCGYDVIADSTNLTDNARNKLLKDIGVEEMTNVEIIYIATICNYKTLLKRNSFREGRERVPEDKIGNMVNNYTFPNEIKEEVFIVDTTEHENWKVKVPNGTKFFEFETNVFDYHYF